MKGKRRENEKEERRERINAGTKEEQSKGRKGGGQER